MSEFKDHFSAHAAHYRLARPLYPPPWFAALAELTPAHDRAWDAGCGNGQASVALAAHFRHVHASDPSASQIANAMPHARVHYATAAAEDCGLPDASIDLVCVAQALHWFDLPRFHAEVRRVLKPGGVIVEWGYGECSVTPAVDAVYQHLYADVLGDYWPAERAHIQNAYADLAFPFQRLPSPPLQMKAQWSLAQYLAYLESWSALQRFRRDRGQDPMRELDGRFRHAWGDPAQIRTVEWETFARVGRSNSMLVGA